MRLRIFCRFFTFHLGSENVFYENCCGFDEIFQTCPLSNFNSKSQLKTKKAIVIPGAGLKLRFLEHGVKYFREVDIYR